eukprot:SAG31_NODE_5145_length_2716_cov_1.567826_2_plen_123_part_00
MTLRRSAFSVTDGLHIFIDGNAFIDDIVYTGFNEHSHHIIVEVRRGSLDHKYSFGAPVLEFGEACDGDAGISGVTAALNMPGGGIHFAEGCAEIAWTGDILADNSFVSNSASRHVEYAVCCA